MSLTYLVCPPVCPAHDTHPPEQMTVVCFRCDVHSNSRLNIRRNKYAIRPVCINQTII